MRCPLPRCSPSGRRFALIRLVFRRCHASPSVVLLAATAAVALVIGCDNGSPTEPSCSVTVSPTSVSVPASGGTASVTITVAQGCAWTAQSNASWLTVAPPSGSGGTSVTLTATANASDSPRTGTATVADHTITVAQDGTPPVPPSCTFSVSPEAATFTKDGGNGTVTVTAPPGCTWVAAANAAWITITSGASGSGSGSVDYTVAENNATAARSAAITAAGRAVDISQAGEPLACQYSVAPVELSTCMGAVVLTTNITTQEGCAWTAQPSASWMDVAAERGTGPSAIRIAVGDNYDAPRQGLLFVRWPSPTQGQNVTLAQAGCRYAVTQTVFAVPAPQSAQNFFVVQQSDPTECGGALQDRCVWSAITDVPWIVITSSMPRRGDDAVNFVVLANTSGPRNATIRVRDQVVHVTQSGLTPLSR